jgi:hypothetical protein
MDEKSREEIFSMFFLQNISLGSYTQILLKIHLFGKIYEPKEDNNYMDIAFPVSAIQSFDFFVEKEALGFEKKNTHVLRRCFQRVDGFFHHRNYSPAKVSAAIFSSWLRCPEHQSNSLPACLSHELYLLAKSKKIHFQEKNIHKLVSVMLQGSIHSFDNDLPSLKRVEKLITYIPSNSDLSLALKAFIEKLHVIKTWESLGLDMSLVETDYASVRFLVKEQLISTIVGLQNTSSNGNHQIDVVNGKLFIRVQGHFTPVASLIDRFHYKDLQLIEETTGKAWNYLLPGGLIQVDRCTSETLLPITRLSPEEKNELLAHASSFEGFSFSAQEVPECVLQIFSEKRSDFLENPIFDAARLVIGGHAAFRIIDEQGDVYSSGSRASTEENKYITGKKNKLVSINAVPGTTDYLEFRPHKGRYVTSIPMTKATCDYLKRELHEMRKRTWRFNYFAQNCSRLVSYVLEMAGVKIDHRMSFYAYAKNLVPTITHIPIIKKIIRKIVLSSHAISQKTLLPSIEEVALLVAKVFMIVTTPLRYCLNAVINVLSMTLGSHRGSPTRADQYGSRPGEGMRVFSSSISSIRSLFSDATTLVYTSGAILEWQSAQKTTLIYTNTYPSMNILPRNGVPVPDRERQCALLKAPLLRQQRLEELRERRKQFFRKSNLFSSKQPTRSSEMQ